MNDRPVFPGGRSMPVRLVLDGRGDRRRAGVTRPFDSPAVRSASARFACRNPRMAKTPSRMPNATIAYPANSAIVATVHQP